MLHVLVTFAAETGPSKAPFYVAGGILALWAVTLSLVGISRGERWPSGDGAARAIMGVSVLLVAAAMTTAVVTA